MIKRDLPPPKHGDKHVVCVLGASDQVNKSAKEILLGTGRISVREMWVLSISPEINRAIIEKVSRRVDFFVLIRQDLDSNVIVNIKRVCNQNDIHLVHVGTPGMKIRSTLFHYPSLKIDRLVTYARARADVVQDSRPAVQEPSVRETVQEPVEVSEAKISKNGCPPHVKAVLVAAMENYRRVVNAEVETVKKQNAQSITIEIVESYAKEVNEAVKVVAEL